ncbi:MAG: hypothetical protein LLG15_13400 [Betaproteobacteria bacterium]|nr:hypothetical protein [Betaproteobacteria bacterium]
MKVSSTSCMDRYIEPEDGIDGPMPKILPTIREFFRKLNRMLTAMAYAEAGDLDAVKEILDEEKSLVTK